MAQASLPWREAPGCVIVRVRVTPKSSLDAIEGLAATADGPALAARVRALPSEGEANGAVERLLAKWLGVPKTSVTVAAGARSRVKSLKVTGEVPELIGRLQTSMESLQKKSAGAEETSKE
jgi:uncharacterized protein YggU (UPF0235/DUF167 family)